MRLLSFSFALIFCCSISTAISQELDTIFLDGGEVFPQTIDGGFNGLFRQHDDKIGKQATPFDAVGHNGLPQRSADYLGKILIVYFWDVWSWDSREGQTLAQNRIIEKYPKEVAVVSFVPEVMWSASPIRTPQMPIDITSNISPYPPQNPICLSLFLFRKNTQIP